MGYSKDEIRDILVDTLGNEQYAQTILEANAGNAAFLDIVLELIKEDYSNDARMGGAYWLPSVDPALLKAREALLLELATDELDAVSCFVFIALAKIHSEKGIELLIRSKIEPDLYWAAQALKEYLHIPCTE